MGIEEHVMGMICEKFPNLDPMVKSEKKEYLQNVVFDSDEGKEALEKMMGSNLQNMVDFHIMANCQSGLIAHYMGVSSISEVDQWPSVYVLGAEGKYKVKQAHPEAGLVIYGVFNDYSDLYWDPPATNESFQKNLDAALTRWNEEGKKVCLVLPSDSLGDEAYNGVNGVTKERFQAFNRISIDLCNKFGFDYIDLGDHVDDSEELQDARHYPRSTWESIGLKLKDVYG